MVRIESLDTEDRRHVTSSTFPADCLDRVREFMNRLKAESLREQANALQPT